MEREIFLSLLETEKPIKMLTRLLRDSYETLVESEIGLVRPATKEEPLVPSLALSF